MFDSNAVDVQRLTSFAWQHAVEYLHWVLSSPMHIAAHVAAGIGVAMMMAGALARTMLPLRWLAVGGNLGLIVFGALQPAPLTLLTAAALLPVNLYRAFEVTRLVRRVQRARVGADMASIWLRPHMKARRYKAGHVLCHKGDVANHLYLLADGKMELAELGKEIPAGRIFGEIALFSEDHTRTQTLRCVTDCTVLEITADTVRQLFYQNPSFAFHLMDLLARRLRSDIMRANGEDPDTE
ncbi:MAG: cyclic nucleotide-binding domain-containing protein [Rubrivivax sp.]